VRTFFKGSQVLLLISAVWMLFIGVLIVIDVAGRNLFHMPLAGTPEIVAVSLVCIAFMQITYAILSDSMLRVTVFQDAAPRGVRAFLNKFQSLCGLIVFAVLVLGSWMLLVDSWESGEYTGEGSFPISLIPARIVVFVGSVFAAIAYLSRLLGIASRAHLTKATEV
jgi:TRAP-type C4-dicarboxylate transport system permease small subunit